jgi:hypothetical protein
MTAPRSESPIPDLSDRPNCKTCLRPLWDIHGRGVHPTDRCDPERAGWRWWEQPEWSEWLAAIVQERPGMGPEVKLGEVKGRDG